MSKELWAYSSVLLIQFFSSFLFFIQGLDGFLGTHVDFIRMIQCGL
uniref:Uncharacterized protein n=1 Tax=Anguilla anguilla TaxID=7936 RepID=A0A0E9WDW6_ANGAN